MRASLLVALLLGCPDPKAGVGKAAAEALFQIEQAPVFGDPIPGAARRVQFSGTKLDVNGVTYDAESWSDKSPGPIFARGQILLLRSDQDTYLAQTAKALALLDDSGAETWILHRGGERAFHLKLRDEAGFQKWLAEAKPGRIRIIQREDGLELQTNVGKLPGLDPRGPSLPIRGGQLDIAALRRALARLKARFNVADEVCVVPSYGTELVKIADVLSGCFESDNRPSFSQLCLVYPRPRLHR